MDLKKTCLYLYAAFAVAALMQFSMITMIVGGILVTGAVWIAHARRKGAAGTVYESHLTWLVRTFWIGTGVYLPVLTLAECFALLAVIDFPALMIRIGMGEIGGAMELQDILKAEYGGTVFALTLAFTLPFLAWWLWRCYAGWKALEAGEPVKNPRSWL